MIFFGLLALLFIGYALLNATQRPGLFAAVVINSYVYAQYFGPLGLITSAIALILAGGELVNPAQSHPPMQKSEWAFLIWVFIAALSIFVSWQFSISLRYGGQLVVYALANYGMGRAFGARENFIRDLALGAVISVILCEPAALFSAQQVSTRLAGDLNAVGMSTMIDVPLTGIPAIVVFAPSLTKFQRGGLIALFFLILLPIAISLGTRSVFVGLGMSLLIYFIFVIRFGIFKSFMKVVGLFMIPLTAAAVIVSSNLFSIASFFLQSRIGIAVAAAAARLVMNFGSGGTIVVDPSLADRLRMYSEATEMIIAQPLFGYGIGAFNYMADGAGNSYPHNTLLEVTVSTGIIGLIIFLAGVLPALVTAAREAAKRPANWEEIFVFGVVADFFTRMQLSMAISMGKILFLMLGVIAVRAAAAQGLPVSRRASTPAVPESAAEAPQAS